MYLKYFYLLVCLVLCSCSSTIPHHPEKKTYTKLDWHSKLKMRKVVVDISNEGEIILTPKSYENLSKNIEDIYENKRMLEETLLFYEAQM